MHVYLQYVLFVCVRTYVCKYAHACTHRGTSNGRRKRVGHSRRQRRGRKAKATTTNTNDDVMMNEDHVINQCPEATNTSNHGDGHTGNPPPAVFTPAVFTPAKEIINEGL